MCRAKNSFAPILFAKRVINSMKMFCKSGCGQQIEVCQEDAHFKICPARIVTCQQCKLDIANNSMQDHVISRHMDKITKEAFIESYTCKECREVLPPELLQMHFITKHENKLMQYFEESNTQPFPLRELPTINPSQQ